MTEQPANTPADVLRRARRTDSDRKRSAVYKTVDTMRRTGTPITFAAVANAANVSRWLVYASGVREYIETARAQQDSDPGCVQRAGKVASEISLRTDLELCKQDNRTLRAEVARLKNLLRRQLGEELEAQSTHTLRLRIDELSEANQRYSAENARLSHDLEVVSARAESVENELIAARGRLRQMMREQNAAVLE